jgi:beta-lactamase class A
MVDDMTAAPPFAERGRAQADSREEGELDMPTRRNFLIGAAALAGCAHSRAHDALAQIETNLGGRIGFSALDTGSGRRIRWRADERFALCSTFKAALAGAVLARIDAGEVQADDVLTFDPANLLGASRATALHPDGRISVIEACEGVVTVSDNTAANALLGLIGGPTAMTEFFRSLGDRITRLDRYELDLNSNIESDPRDTTTPDAMLDSLQALLLGDALNGASRSLLAEWMVNEQNGKARLRAGLPMAGKRGDWRVANKPGTSANGAVNDIGVAWPPSGRPIILIAYTNAPGTDIAAGEAAIARTAAHTAREFGLA